MEAMKIDKYCNKVHNPLVSQTTIQVCSVYHYKAVDNDFIRDPEEGEMSRSYNPATPTFYSGDDIGAMTGFSIAGNGGIRFEGRVCGSNGTTFKANATVSCDRESRHCADVVATVERWCVVIIASADLFSFLVGG